MTTPPSYATAVEQFRKFLLDHGLRTDFCWVWQDDICSLRQPGSIKSFSRPIYVHSTVLTTQDSLAEVRYQEGLKQGFGICLQVAFLLRNVPCCFIQLPVNSEDAAYQMVDGLKLSIPTNMPETRAVTNGITWNLLSWFFGPPRDFWLKEMPWRKDAARPLCQ